MRVNRALIASALVVAAPARAEECPAEHAAMGHCAPTSPSSECSPEHAAMGHCTPTSTSSECSSEHAAMGHCTPTSTSKECSPEHAAMGHCTPSSAGSSVRFAATLGVIAATYRSPLFEGNYQGAKIGASIAFDRFSLSAEIIEYRLERNGRASNGPGDVMLHAHATLVKRGAIAGGVMVMGSLPTGNDDRGFGMGHVMLMSELFATWSSGRLFIDAKAGYSYAIGGAAAHAEHGADTWPLVDPMNAQEITFGIRPIYMLAPALGAGAHAAGAVPIGDGASRLVAGGHVIWIAGRVVTAFEIAGGVVGDPFGLRGTLTTTVRLR